MLDFSNYNSKRLQDTLMGDSSGDGGYSIGFNNNGSSDIFNKPSSDNFSALDTYLSTINPETYKRPAKSSKLKKLVVASALALTVSVMADYTLAFTNDSTAITTHVVNYFSKQANKIDTYIFGK